MTGIEGGQPKLFIFPHAGGTPQYYVPFAKAFTTDVKRTAVQYPRQGGKQDFGSFTSLSALADEVTKMVSPDKQGGASPIFFFGHSMGAVLAFEVARRHETSTGRPVLTVFASGSRAPSRYGDEREFKDDVALVGVMRELGGTDPRVLSDPELLSTFLPAFRNDYRALQAYHRGNAVGISAPIVVMTALDDPKTSDAAARAWHEHTTGGGDVHVFAGGHFFLEKQPQKVIEVVTQALRAAG